LVDNSSDVFKELNFYRKEIFFENEKMKSDAALESLKLLFSGKMSEDRLHAFIRDFYLAVAHENGVKISEMNLYALPLKEFPVTCERIYCLCIDTYIQAKTEIIRYLLRRGAIELDVSEEPDQAELRMAMQTQMYDFEEVMLYFIECFSLWES